MKLPVILLVAMCIVVGLLPALTFWAAGVAWPPARWPARRLPEYHLAIWHGFNLPLPGEPADRDWWPVGLYLWLARASACTDQLRGLVRRRHRTRDLRNG